MSFIFIDFSFIELYCFMFDLLGEDNFVLFLGDLENFELGEFVNC